MTSIRQAVFPNDTAAVTGLWQEFVANSTVNLDYQQNDSEFSNLPGKYAAPTGCILLAEREAAQVGCGALRKVTDDICEMKRLYVRPAARGTGLGRQLAERLIAEGRARGYREMRLDVHGIFLAARELYARLGFEPAPPISYNPVPGAHFLGLRL